uniref:DDE Tnp4 domain-containing protein n=1 Tax=Gouania willdenowi TaxID=441366 RepID=A0A8C5E829_GOUWI
MLPFVVVVVVSACKRRTIALLLLLARLRRRSGRRRCLHWVHPLNQHRCFHNLVAELRLDSQRHHRYFRMNAEQMNELLSFIEPKQRLAVALRYLASGDSLSLAFSYRLGHSAIGKEMMEKYLPRPTPDTWKEVAQTFWEKWNFPNCLGALDGKHVVIQAPPLSGSQYFNYKKTFSSVLLALVDADYKFRCIQVGDWEDKRWMVECMQDQTCTSLPGAAHLGDVPFAMVADAAFPLKPYLMKPYPRHNLTKKKRIFNYRLSRARMIVENAFGILASQWRILQRRINLHPENVDTLVMAACILHNFLLAPSENPRLLEEAEGGRQMAPVPNMGGNRASKEACAGESAFTEGNY